MNNPSTMQAADNADLNSRWLALLQNEIGVLTSNNLLLQAQQEMLNTRIAQMASALAANEQTLLDLGTTNAMLKKKVVEYQEQEIQKKRSVKRGGLSTNG